MPYGHETGEDGWGGDFWEEMAGAISEQPSEFWQEIQQPIGYVEPSEFWQDVSGAISGEVPITMDIPTGTAPAPATKPTTSPVAAPALPSLTGTPQLATAGIGGVDWHKWLPILLAAGLGVGIWWYYRKR